MATQKNLKLWHWNEMVDSFHGESDRGAAVLAAGFVENYLASYLRSFMVNLDTAKELFGGFGPLSSFGQRIATAYAFGFVSKELYTDLSLIRKIRNSFAHSPFDTTFATEGVAELAVQLSTYDVATDPPPKSSREHNRFAYLFACGFFCARASTSLELSRAGSDFENRDSE